jgi:Raf kinase inhibitor-like YbhB/YbcL family protein
MSRRFTALISLTIGLFAAGCSSTPEIQGAVIASPPASSPAAQATPIDPGADLSQGAPDTVSPDVTPLPGESVVVQGDGVAQGLLTLESPAFAAGDPIPLRFSCDGEDVSPGLAWGSPPGGTVAFALITDDPDAPGGTWVHWVIYDIPAESRGLPEAIPTDAELPDGSRQGINSGRRLGYAGPCPPGETHRYFFKLFALNQRLDLAPGLSADDLTAAMDTHILGEAVLMGTYTRN